MAADKVRVQTNDGDILEIDLDIAKQWAPIKNMYEAFGTLNTEEKPIELTNVDTETLTKIMEWAEHHKQDGLDTEDAEPRPKKYVEIKEWDNTYFQVKQEMLFGIIMAANYLGMTVLLDMACKIVANMIKDKTPAEVRQTFNIPNDLPPLEQPQ